MIKHFFFPVFLFSVVWVSGALAATNNETFTVTATLIGDTATPTTPAIVSVIPAAYNQIDVSWSTSTDNVAIGGYQVYRDAVQIATTTLLSYSDTGLSASTTYAYTVRAFDVSFNYSNLSAAVATTTSAAPPAPTTTIDSVEPDNGSSVRGRGGIQLLNLEVAPSVYSAALNWRTSVYARFTLRWGRTVNYELGFVSNEVFAKEHKTRVTDLEPNTVYEYEIIGYTEAGTPHVLARDQFITAAAREVTPPPNVSNLQAKLQSGGVSLSWVNPTETDFSHVRVVRSHLYFPTDPFDGFVVYQGGGTAVLDESAFNLSSDAFYTVFAYDELGNVSSGAVGYVQQGQGMSPVPATVQTQAPQSTNRDTDTTSIGRAVSDESIMLEVSDIEVWQSGSQRRSDHVHRFYLIHDAPATIRIGYEKLPEHLKTIVVTLTHPGNDNQIFSFLLRINQDKSAYEATVAPLAIAGEYDMTVSMIDFQTNMVSDVAGVLVVTVADDEKDRAVSSVRSFVPSPHAILVTTGCLLALLLLLLVFLVRRQRSR